MRFVQWILGRKQESQHAKAVTRNMPKTVMWLLRHRASRQHYDVYTHIYIYIMWASRWSGPLWAQLLFWPGFWKVIYLYHSKREIGFKHQSIHPFPMWLKGPISAEGEGLNRAEREDRIDQREPCGSRCKINNSLGFQASFPSSPYLWACKHQIGVS